ncbi:hypothetical protein [Pedobacter gandavensis]|uniref:hypothetical protein n=1 Tax=Pedobacter gandavensis TaxID=2679963 RepID=UPI00292E0B9F|nr:hypothetical protein [Pedobacter gandavensis]
MKKIKIFPLVLVPSLIIFGCNNFKSKTISDVISGTKSTAVSKAKADAKEVCDCNQNLLKDPAKAAADYVGGLKCTALLSEKLLKYKESPKELVEFNTYLDSCSIALYNENVNK